MSSVQEHYDRHLGPVYSWMLGDMTATLENARTELRELGIDVRAPGVAVDLGAGPGVHSILLAEFGFSVIALDTCAELHEELTHHAGAWPIRPILGDLTSFRTHCPGLVDVILCMGDTLTHLPTQETVERLFRDVKAALAPGGIFVATFRDYVSAPLEGVSRFIPVRSDEQRILTCFLEYRDTVVMVHDLLHVRAAAGWEMRLSAYPKLRLDPTWAQATLSRLGIAAKLEAGSRGMVRLIGSMEPTR
jgi:SAM-dependent methyltransferase